MFSSIHCHKSSFDLSNVVVTVYCGKWRRKHITIMWSIREAENSLLQKDHKGKIDYDINDFFYGIV